MRPVRLPFLAIVATCVIAASTNTAAGTDMAYPPTPLKPVVDTYHGVAVTDDYRWLEDDNSPEVKAWIDAQNKVTRAYLDGIAQRPEIARRVAALLNARTVRRFNFEFRQRLFAIKFAPPSSQPLLVTLPPAVG